MKTPYTIAIDGHSSCGKSTVAKDIAKMLGIAYVDTGAMYRAVTLHALRNKFFKGGKANEEAIIASLNDITISFCYNDRTLRNETLLNGEVVEKEIRGLDVSNKVSIVSAIGAVRHKLVEWQRAMAQGTSLVMDGRDIGTVVFPNAELKIFMTASDEVRAQRRFKELTAKGEKVTFDEVLENVRQRDLLDSTRAESPLRQADDALLLDNSEMNVIEQFEWIMDRMRERNLI